MSHPFGWLFIYYIRNESSLFISTLLSINSYTFLICFCLSLNVVSHKPIHTTSIRYNRRGKPSYLRYSRNKTVAAINPKTKHVNTTWKYHTKLMNKFLRGGK